MENRNLCKNKFILALANLLNKGSGTIVGVDLKNNKFGFCKCCHKFNLIGRNDGLCDGCYLQNLEESIYIDELE